MWKQHTNNMQQLQEKLAEREARILQLQQQARHQRSWVPESRLMNTASQKEILELKAELKKLYQKIDEQKPEKKSDDNDELVRLELQKMQQELAKMHTLVKKQRNALLLAQVSPRKTRSRAKKPKSPLESIPEETVLPTPAPSPAAPAPPAVQEEVTAEEEAISEEVQDTPEPEETQPEPEQ